MDSPRRRLNILISAMGPHLPSKAAMNGAGLGSEGDWEVWWSQEPSSLMFFPLHWNLSWPKWPADQDVFWTSQLTLKVPQLPPKNTQHPETTLLDATYRARSGDSGEPSLPPRQGPEHVTSKGEDNRLLSLQAAWLERSEHKHVGRPNRRAEPDSPLEPGENCGFMPLNFLFKNGWGVGGKGKENGRYL